MAAEEKNRKRIMMVCAAVVFLVGAIFSVLTQTGAAVTPMTPLGPGWIKFDAASENGSPTSTIPYGVQIHKADASGNAAITGVAWSTPYGWLSFNAIDLIGCPDAPTQTVPGAPCIASVNLSNGQVSGWAKFVQTGNWVHLRGSGYGVTFDSASKTFSGRAWGSELTGWIGFGVDTCTQSGAPCTVRAELVNQGPIASNVTIQEPAPPESWCTSSPYYKVFWSYFDPDSNPQASARISFVKTDGTVTYATTISGTATSFQIDNPLGAPANLAPGTNYKVQVQVSDGTDSSNVAESVAFSTPPHYYPLVNFTVSPSPFTAPNIETFTGEVQSRANNTASGPFTWKWEFSNSGPPQPNDSTSTVSVLIQRFPAVATSTVTDSDNHSCQASREYGGAFGGSGSPIKRRVFREL